MTSNAFSRVDSGKVVSTTPADTETRRQYSLDHMPKVEEKKWALSRCREGTPHNTRREKPVRSPATPRSGTFSSSTRVLSSIDGSTGRTMKNTQFMIRIGWIVLTFGIGCQDYGLGGGEEWDPADQPDQLGQTMHTDEFVQRTAEASDILFVVDNSGSMTEERQALIDNFAVFMAFLADTPMDYHIGVVTLDDPEDPPIGTLLGSPNYMDSSMADEVEDHFNAVINSIQTNPDGTCEVGLEASFRAVSPGPVGYEDTSNVGFYREEALLSVVIISDEDDGSSEGADCPTPEAFIHHSEYSPWIVVLKGSQTADLIYFTAIVGDAQTGCSSVWGNAEPGRGYLDVVDYLGEEHSTFFSICEHDWSEVMIRIGLAAAGLRTAFHLSHVPVEGTLQVFLDLDRDGPEEEFEIFEDPSEQTPYSFVYDRISNSLMFTVENLPPESSVLRVEYQQEQDA